MTKFIKLIKLYLVNKNFIFELVRYEILNKNKNSYFRFFWIIINPLVLLIIYSFIFNFIFVSKLDLDISDNYLIYFFPGLISWIFIQQSLSSSANSLISNNHLLKHITFPIEIIPIKSILITALNFLIQILFVIVFIFIQTYKFSPLLILLPIAIFFQILFLFGVGLIISILSTVFRDIKELITIFNIIGIFILPIIFMDHNTPNILMNVIQINPLSHFIWIYQDIFYYQSFYHPLSWIITPILSVFTWIIGHFFIHIINEKIKRG